MKLGDVQSVMQITIALNLAYFSFREIRTPAFSRFGRKVARIDQKLAQVQALLAKITKPERPIPGDEATSLWIKSDNLQAQLRMHSANINLFRHPYTDNMEAFDRAIRVVSLCAAALGFIALVLASIYATEQIDLPWFLLATLLFLTPTVMSIRYYVLILGLMNRTAADVDSIEKAVDEVHDAATPLARRSNELAKARVAARE
jgi:hypothetical protein